MPGKGKPFAAGNKMGKGRPPGSRNKSNRPGQDLLDQYGEKIVGKCIALAFKGDTKALQLCLDRVLPARRELPVKLGKLALTTMRDLSNASERVMAQVASGKLTTSSGHAFVELIERRRKILESEEFDRRLRALEERS